MRVMVQRFTLGRDSDAVTVYPKAYLLALSEPLRHPLAGADLDGLAWVTVWVRHGDGQPTEVSPARYLSLDEADEWFLQDVAAAVDQGWLLDGTFTVERPSAPRNASNRALENWLTIMLPWITSGKGAVLV
jgi:hypothetical protein